jgi:hypothetical protein
VYVLYFTGPDCDTDHYLVVAKFGERLAVSKNCTIVWHGKIQSQEAKLAADQEMVLN